jgi:NAD(P)H dehydrogenase (quinone)
MKVSVILAHPDPGSLNHAIAATVVQTLEANGHEAILHDLYRERFDPVLPMKELSREAALPSEIARHCGEIAAADGIVIVHPNWWGQPPAILKGWIDRVLRPGVAYEFLEGDAGEGVPRGLLKARAAVVFNTSNTETHREQRVFGDPLEAMWKRCIFELCGVKRVVRKTFTIVVTSTEEQRRQWLAEAAGIIDSEFPKGA